MGQEKAIYGKSALKQLDVFNKKRSREYLLQITVVVEEILNKVKRKISNKD